MGALDGFKVLDFTTLLPGPYATMTLADLGAEVLKVSGRDKYDLVVNWPPVIEGAQVTGAQAWLGRNKKTIFPVLWISSVLAMKSCAKSIPV